MLHLFINSLQPIIIVRHTRHYYHVFKLVLNKIYHCSHHHTWIGIRNLKMMVLVSIIVHLYQYLLGQV